MNTSKQHRRSTLGNSLMNSGVNWRHRCSTVSKTQSNLSLHHSCQRHDTEVIFLWRSTVSSYESKCPSALWGEGCDRELPNQVSHRINTWQVMPLGSRLNQFRQKDSINEWNSLPGSHTINTASVNSAWVRTAPCAKKSWPVSGSGTKAVKIIIRNKPNFLKKKRVLKWTKYGFDIQKGLFFYSNVANSASLISSPKLE